MLLYRHVNNEEKQQIKERLEGIKKGKCTPVQVATTSSFTSQFSSPATVSAFQSNSFRLGGLTTQTPQLALPSSALVNSALLRIPFARASEFHTQRIPLAPHTPLQSHSLSSFLDEHIAALKKQLGLQ